jgi:hypothetical protein
MGKGPGLGMLGGALAGLGGGLLYNHLKESSDVNSVAMDYLDDIMQKHEARNAVYDAKIKSIEARMANPEGAVGRMVERMPTAAKWGIGLSLGGLGIYGLARLLHPENYKAASLHGLLWKEARPSFMAEPPEPEVVPTAWAKHLSFKPNAYAATQIGRNPFEQPQMSEALHVPGATRMLKSPGLLSKLQQGATMVAKRRL